MADVLADAGLKLSLAGAAIAFCGRAGKFVYEDVRGYYREHQRRHEALIRFYVDTFITVENCNESLTENAVSGMIASIEKFEAYGGKYKAYIASIDDAKAKTDLESFLYKLPDYLISEVASYITAHNLALMQYNKMATEEFQALSIARKSDAIRDPYKTFEEVRDRGRNVMAKIEYLPKCSQFRKLQDECSVKRKSLDKGANRAEHVDDSNRLTRTGGT